MSTATMPTIQPAPTAASIMDKTVCISVRFSMPGNSKKVSASVVSSDADKSLLRVSKKLLDSPELEAVQRVQRMTRTYLASRCLPSLFREGVYLLPIALIEQVEARMQEYMQMFAAAITVFIKVYEVEKQATMGRLGELANPADYLSTEKMMAAFDFEWQYISFSTPAKLKEISADFFKQEHAKMQASVEQATTAIQQVLREAMAKFVEDLVQRLKPAVDGKKKIIKPSKLLDNFQDFLVNFDVRNLTDDKELQAIKDKALLLLKGVDPEALCSQDTVRDKIHAGFSDLKVMLDEMMVDQGDRMITFDED